MTVYMAGFLLAVCSGLVFLGLIFPIERLPRWSRTHDKLLHAAAFALLAVLASLSMPGTQAVVIWMVLAAAGLMGEVAQHLSPHRQYCWRDAVANALGAAAGLTGFQWWLWCWANVV